MQSEYSALRKLLSPTPPSAWPHLHRPHLLLLSVCDAIFTGYPIQLVCMLLFCICVAVLRLMPFHAALALFERGDYMHASTWAVQVLRRMGYHDE